MKSETEIMNEIKENFKKLSGVDVTEIVERFFSNNEILEVIEKWDLDDKNDVLREIKNLIKYHQ